MTIKVKQLIELLKDHADPNAEVYLEGCDCEGDCIGIELEPILNRVLLCRYESGLTIMPPKE